MNRFGRIKNTALSAAVLAGVAIGNPVGAADPSTPTPTPKDCGVGYITQITVGNPGGAATQGEIDYTQQTFFKFTPSIQPKPSNSTCTTVKGGWYFIFRYVTAGQYDIFNHLNTDQAAILRAAFLSGTPVTFSTSTGAGYNGMANNLTIVADPATLQ